MTDEAWRSLAAALDRRPFEPAVRFWLRDDDAVAVTPALDRLGHLAADSGAPLLLAVIPAGATPPLGAWTLEHPLVTPCQHGYAHRNHAVPPERACEVGGARSDDAVVLDLAEGRAAMDRVFGARWLKLLVPPWNRIRPSLVPRLAEAGYVALSTFAGALPDDARALPMLDCDLDIIDWRNGRRGREDEDGCRRLVTAIGAARLTGAPIGVLTHHLVHDEQAWGFLARLLPLLHRHPGAVFVGAEEAIAAGSRSAT